MRTDTRPNSIGRRPYPQVAVLHLCDIAGIYPAVRKVLGRFPPEPNDELQGVSAQAIEDLLEVPRIAVVPVRGEARYWVWQGVRAYLRLVDRDWKGAISVIDFGSRMSEERIAYLAEKDWVFDSLFSSRSRKSDWAYAQEWEAGTPYICRPTKSGKRRLSGRNLFSTVHGLDRRCFRADKVSRSSTSGPKPGAEIDGKEGGDG